MRANAYPREKWRSTFWKPRFAIDGDDEQRIRSKSSASGRVDEVIGAARGMLDARVRTAARHRCERRKDG